MTDLIVAGAGPAGLATAIYASLGNLSVVVLERRHPPLAKACGEGVMPYGVCALEEMRVDLSDATFAPFSGVRYIDGDFVAEGRFRGRPGIGIRREDLSRTLLSRAAALGVELRFGCGVESWTRTAMGVRVRTGQGDIEARLLVGADGLLSRIRREAGLAARRPRPPTRFGIRRHYEVEPWSDLVEVHLADGLEAYVTPVGPSQMGIALLWTRTTSVRADGEADASRGRETRERADEESPMGISRGQFDRLLERFPLLSERLSAARPLDQPIGAGPFHQPVKRRHAAGVALVGDAAGYLDALTGDGVALGFATARALVAVVAAGHPLSAYEAAWRTITRRHRYFTAVLLTHVRHPRLRRRTVGFLASRPDLLGRLLSAYVGGSGRSWARR